MSASSGIYIILNTVNGKMYIGSSKNTKIRWRRHYRSLIKGDHHCAHLRHAALKYGAEVFVFLMVEEILELRTLVTREQDWIDACPKDMKYNSSPTAGSSLGVKLTQDQRSKISAALKGVPKSTEHKKACSIGQSLRAKKPEEKERIEVFSKNRIGKKNTPEHCAKAGKAIKASIHHRVSYNGGGNPAARGCAIGELIFSCVKDAVVSTGLSKYRLKLNPKFRYLTKNVTNSAPAYPAP